MPKRRASKRTDPLLQTAQWRGEIRNYHIAAGLPCARCGGAIMYGAPRYYPGTRKVNPRSLVIGHIIGRDQGRRLGWTPAMLNSISNTQPEHARCSDRSGAIYGNKIRNVAVQAARALKTTRNW